MSLRGLAGVPVGVLLGVAAARRGANRRYAERSPAAADAFDVSRAVVDVLDRLQSMTVIVDTDQHVVRSSDSAQALGLVRDGRLVHAELDALVRAVHRDRTARELELDVPRGPLGAGRLLLWARVAPLGRGHVLALVEDNTQSRRVEETRRDFVANVSHELKTPVGGLTLLAEAMDEARDDPAAVHRFATRMRTETERLGRLVQEIVELSRLQASDAPQGAVRVDVRGCVHDALDQLKVVADNRDIAIDADLGAAHATQIFGDANLITTAVRNLVENAINYSGAGTTVRVSMHTAGDVLEVRIADQGSGISEADLDRIFERFYRVDAARSRSTGGTGLGLAIVKHICANHGGEVAVESVEGEGSTFTLRLPLADPGRLDEPPTTRKDPS